MTRGRSARAVSPSYNAMATGFTPNANFHERAAAVVALLSTSRWCANLICGTFYIHLKQRCWLGVLPFMVMKERGRIKKAVVLFPTRGQ